MNGFIRFSFLKNKKEIVKIGQIKVSKIKILLNEPSPNLNG